MQTIRRFGCWITSILLLAASAWLSIIYSDYYYILVLFFAILALIGLYDLLQVKHSLRRNYPLIARIRWIMEYLRPYLRQYIVESNLDGRPYNRNERSLIYARSKNQEDYHPFGTDLDVYSSEYEFISQSIAPIPEEQVEDLRIQIGSKQCTKPYSASLLNISAMSFGSLGANAIEALNHGAKTGNFYHDTGEGSASIYHKKHGGDLVWELGTGYFGCRDKDGNFDLQQFKDQAQADQIKMIEIKLSQGAKPGHGGVLPKEKVTKEIAETRRVPMGQDCISPSYHSAFNTPVEMMQWVAILREASGGKPVGIKLCVGQPHEVMAIIKAMLKTKIMLDFIVVDGAEGGTGAAPVEFSNHLGMPLREGLIMVRNALVGSGLKDQIKLAASGKVATAFSIATNCALGADWSNAARAFMFSVGCVMAKRCNTDTCPSGVATQSKSRQRGLVVPDKAKRAAQFHKRTIDTLRQLTAACGVKHPQELNPSHIYYRKNPVEVTTLDKVHVFLNKNELLHGTQNIIYANWWDIATADSFKPIEEV